VLADVLEPLRRLRSGGTQPDVDVPSRHRDDLQGLRAIAVLLVVFSHVGIPHLAGGFVGVDVFFVLSGFLITGLLLREAGEHHAVSLRDFYTRRAKRILPAAALTLVVTDLAAYWLLNIVRARQVITDSFWASLFGANIHFAKIGTDYFARAQPPSPVQHFWTLAVEEQFYLVWPALLAAIVFGVALTKRQRRRRNRKPFDGTAITRLLIVTGAIFFVSLALSIYQTGTRPTLAYFSTLTRAWELALGALLAIAAPKLLTATRAGVRTAAGWCGVAAIVAAAVLFTDETPFPGAAALLPTLGAAAVIFAGLGAPRGVGRILAMTPLRYIGDRSYTWYLWHWPFLAIAAQHQGQALTLQTKLLLAAAAFAASVVTYAVYENPIRHLELEPAATGVLATVSVCAVVFAGGYGLTQIHAKEDALREVATPTPIGPTEVERAAKDVALYKKLDTQLAADAALPAVEESITAARKRAAIPQPLSPSPAALLTDRYHFPGGCVTRDGQTSSTVCTLGRVGAPRKVVVIGDSHAEMWMPAIVAMATTDGWQVVPLVKDGCGPTQWGSASSGECRSWFKWAVRQANAARPYVTLVGGRYAGIYGSNGDLQANTIRGMSDLLTALRGSKNLVLIEDPPGQVEEPVDCLLHGGASLSRCTTTLTNAQAGENDNTTGRLTGFAGVRLLKTKRWFCSGNTCPMVIGHTIAYIDTNHVSLAYATALAPAFRLGFLKALKSAPATG
jgi:peptidoglycan/LPS O-acetylase OafA/YrhL